MKKLWALRYVLGGLFAFVLGLTVLGWAVLWFPLYSVLGVVVIVGLILAWQPRVRKERERTKKLVHDAFHAAYAHESQQPSLEMSSSYGYPAFKVQFRSKPELLAAADRNEIFKREIDRIFCGSGPRSRPFSADKAIFFTYDGFLDEVLARYKPA